MGAPFGNQFAKGKATGRKSAYQEYADADRLHEMFFNPNRVKQAMKAEKDGNLSMEDKFILEAIKGSPRPLTKAFDKVYPDKQQIDHRGNITVEVVSFGEQKASDPPVGDTTQPDESAREANTTAV